MGLAASTLARIASSTPEVSFDNSFPATSNSAAGAMASGQQTVLMSGETITSVEEIPAQQTGTALPLAALAKDTPKMRAAARYLTGKVAASDEAEAAATDKELDAVTSAETDGGSGAAQSCAISPWCTATRENERAADMRCHLHPPRYQIQPHQLFHRHIDIFWSFQSLHQL